MRAHRCFSGLIVIFAAAACATAGASPEDGVRRDPNLITAEELAPYLDRPAYDAVAELRPRWLTTRGNVSLTTTDDRRPAVIVDGQTNRLDILQSMRSVEIASLRFISAADATLRWGTGYPNGAIEVTTRHR